MTSVRDIVVKDDDLVVGTHGRGFWILDDITPLRQIDAATASAGRRAVQADRPPGACAGTRAPTRRGRPRSRPAPNPPEGAIINYYLKRPASGPVTLEILQDAHGRMVRRYSSSRYRRRRFRSRRLRRCRSTGIAPPQTLSAAAGMHRFVWDVHYQPIADGGGAGGGRGRPADHGDPVQHGAGADDAVGAARDLHASS